MAYIETKIINKGSGHFKYWLMIRKAWGIKTTPSQMKTCPYVQTMIWLSVLTVFFSIIVPVIPIGWLAIKFMRISYKYCEMFWLGQRWNDLLDKCGVAKVLDEVPNELEKRPLLALASSGAWVLMLLFIVVVFAAAIYYMIVAAIGSFFITLFTSIPQWPAGIWAATCWGVSVIGWLFIYIGWGLFWIVALVGWFVLLGQELLTYAFAGISWFVWTVVSWCSEVVMSAVFWTSVFQYISWFFLIVISVLLFGVVSFVIAYAMYKFFTLSSTKKLLLWLHFKLNGFVEARLAAAERRSRERKEARRESIEKEKLEEEPDPYYTYEPEEPSQPGVIENFLVIILRPVVLVCVGITFVLKMIWAPIGSLFSMICKEMNKWQREIWSYHIYVKGGTVKCLGLTSLLWEYVVALARRSCPLVEFKEESEIEALRTFLAYEWENDLGEMRRQVIALNEKDEEVSRLEKEIRHQRDVVNHQAQLASLHKAKETKADSPAQVYERFK